MQKIIFGLSLDASTFHEKEGVYFFGQLDFLRWMEQQLGLAWPAKNYSWLRIAFYRKVLKSFLESHPQAFFAESFSVDSYGTTRAVLALRDDLRLSRWDFAEEKDMPKRLIDLSRLEVYAREFIMDDDTTHQVFFNGFADRFLEVESALEADCLKGLELTLVEPLALLPTWWQRMVGGLKGYGVEVLEPNTKAQPEEGTDLQVVAQVIGNQSFKGDKIKLKGDKSLLIVQVARDYEGLESFAYNAKNRDGGQPFLVMPRDVKLPDLVFEMDGLPVSGNTSVSDLRPSQQLIKLAHSFLWKPVDLSKILEFLNLPYSPLHSHLAVRLAGALQKRPGFDNEAWNRAIDDFGNSTKVEAVDKEAALFEYRFWFERKTYFQKAQIPKSEVFTIYQHLMRWAKGHLSSQSAGAIYMSIYRLSLDMMDLLDAIEEDKVSFLDLEKLSGIVIQATPATFKKREVGASNFAQDPGAVVFPFAEIVWFNFVSTGSDYLAPKYMKPEIAFLQQLHVRLTLPDLENSLRKWKRYQPLLLAEDRLILVVPEKVDGVYANRHPLHYELEAMIENIESITINAVDDMSKLAQIFAIRDSQEAMPRDGFLEAPIINIKSFDVQKDVDYFGVTEVETFLYYPHNWVLRKQMKLYGSSLSKIKDISMLQGNIAHQIFEELLNNKLHLADNEDIRSWYGDAFFQLIEAEGLPFLEFGKEPDLISFRKKLFVSILSFVHALRQNNWNVVATEETLNGKLGLKPIKGITDVVLERDGHYLIVDLKWGGKTFRKTMLKNKADIQLMMYSRYFGDENKWWDACFYLIRDGIFITRTDGLFDGAEMVLGQGLFSDIYEDMHDKLVKTLDWRYDQLKNGHLELRMSQHIDALNEHYGEVLLDLMPLKDEDYRFDDFGALLGSVE